MSDKVEFKTDAHIFFIEKDIIKTSDNYYIVTEVKGNNISMKKISKFKMFILKFWTYLLKLIKSMY